MGPKGYTPRGPPLRYAPFRPLPQLLGHFRLEQAPPKISNNLRAPPPTHVRGCTCPLEGIPSSGPRDNPSPLLGPSPPSIWTRFPDNLVLVTGVFGPGPLLPLGLSPASMAASAVWGTISGPGPRREMGPRPKTYQGMSNNALDLVHGAQLSIHQSFTHQWVHQQVHPYLHISLRFK